MSPSCLADKIKKHSMSSLPVCGGCVTCTLTVCFPTLLLVILKPLFVLAVVFLGRHSRQHRAKCVQVCGPHNGGEGTDQESCKAPDQSTQGNVLYPSAAAVLCVNSAFSPLFSRCVGLCFAVGLITHQTHSLPTATAVSLSRSLRVFSVFTRCFSVAMHGVRAG